MLSGDEVEAVGRDEAVDPAASKQGVSKLGLHRDLSTGFVLSVHSCPAIFSRTMTHCWYEIHVFSLPSVHLEPEKGGADLLVMALKVSW